MSEQKQRRCVLIGRLGSGKTTIFNKICNQKQLADHQLYSNTTKIQQSHSKYGNFNYLVVDTPGLGAENQVVDHTMNIIAALMDGPINRILVVIRFGDRLDNVQSEIKRSIKSLKRFTTLITILINHIDECKIDKNIFYRESQKMIKEQFNIQSIIFTEINDQEERLCLAIKNELDQNFQQLSITDDEFYHLMKNLKYDEKLEQGKKQFLDEFKRFYRSCIKFLDEFQCNIKDQDQILHYLHIFVRQQALLRQENFEKQYGTLMAAEYVKNNDAVSAYIYYTVLKYSIKNHVQELIDKINKKMIYPENHPFNQLRKCPYCNIIWFKGTGCDDIYCGKKMDRQEEKKLLQQIENSQAKFQFTYENGNIEYKEINRPNNLIQQSFNDQETQFIQAQSIILSNEMRNEQNQKIQINKPNTPIAVYPNRNKDLKTKMRQKKIKFQHPEVKVRKGKLQNKVLQQNQNFVAKHSKGVKTLTSEQIIKHPARQFPLNQVPKQQIQQNQIQIAQNQIPTIQAQQPYDYQYQTRSIWFREDKLSLQELNLMKQNKQKGCGRQFNWQNAPILDFEELQLHHELLNQIYTQEDQQYKRDFDLIKNSLIEKALQEKLIL